MAGREALAMDDAALLVGPGVPVRVDHAWIWETGHRGAIRRVPPAVSKHQRVDLYGSAAGGLVIVGTAIKVTTQTTHTALEILAEFDDHSAPTVPHDRKADLEDLDNQVHPFGTEEKWSS